MNRTNSMCVHMHRHKYTCTYVCYKGGFIGLERGWVAHQQPSAHWRGRDLGSQECLRSFDPTLKFGSFLESCCYWISVEELKNWPDAWWAAMAVGGVTWSRKRLAGWRVAFPCLPSSSGQFALLKVPLIFRVDLFLVIVPCATPLETSLEAYRCVSPVWDIS